MAKKLLNARLDIPNARADKPTIAFANKEMPKRIPITVNANPRSDRTKAKTSNVNALSTPNDGET